MEIKYEAVFGDQALFDGAPEDAVIAIKRPFISGVRSEKIYFFSTTFDAVMEAGSSFNFNNVILKKSEYAERRIIRTPIWTVEDQKAGKLPEVGCRVDFCHKLNTNWRTGEIKYIDDRVAVIKADAVDRPFVYEVDRVEFKPIESPEEKAERLREEWCIKALSSCSILSGMQKYELKRLGGYIEDIYDALLSGDLPVPVKDAK